MEHNRTNTDNNSRRRETRWKRCKEQRPGHKLQADVRFAEPLGSEGPQEEVLLVHRDRRLHPTPGAACLPAQRPDDCHRVHRSCPVQAPFAVDQVQTDIGQEFGSAFHWHLIDEGIGHIEIGPRTPRLTGKVERSHRIDSEEFYCLLEGEVIGDARLLETRLQEWEDY